jgi:hypothetical protein
MRQFPSKRFSRGISNGPACKNLTGMLDVRGTPELRGAGLDLRLGRTRGVWEARLFRDRVRPDSRRSVAIAA